jgi:CPA2 family monovalent cation:H+ antiporter-2
MIHDLGIIMLTAGFTSLLCKFLKQPVVLGYIVAGLLVGPYVFGSSWVSDEESVETWGQIGVIFLLFSLGLEFSYKKLVQMGTTALIGCFTIVVGMMSCGFLLGRAMGWDQMNSLFLGGMLCMSSTTIVFKALDDLGLRQQKFANICFGILVVEDLFAVVLMVLLASLAVNQTFDGGEMAWQVGKLVAYLLFWFASGLFIIPTLLRVCKQHLNDETLTIVALGLCLGMVLLAEGAGFSSALGAFVMGSILAETVEAEKIEHLLSPIKNMFGAVFFVSVGMMIDPALLLKYWLPISLITLLVIIGQIVFATLGVVLSGQPLKTAMQAAFSLTQVGEFAFIIANFGTEKGVTEPFLYPVIVAVSVITTFLTPYTIRLAEPAYERFDKILPRRWKLLLDAYGQSRSTQKEASLTQKYMSKTIFTVVLYAIVCIFITALYFALVNDKIITLVNDFVGTIFHEPHLWIGRLVSLALVFTVLSPFIYQLLNKEKRNRDANQLWESGSLLTRGILVVFNAFRVVLALAIIIFCIGKIFDATIGIVLAMAFAIFIFILKSPQIKQRSHLIEENFLVNLSAREVAMREGKKAEKKNASQSGYSTDIDGMHFGEVTIPKTSSVLGRTLRDLDIRNKTGVSVIRILRSSGNVNNPSATERFQPGDRVVVNGSVSDIEFFKIFVDTEQLPNQ